MGKSWPAPQGHSTFKASITLHPGSPCPRANFAISCKRFAAIYKEMYEKLSCPGLLGMEGNPPTRDNFSPYIQALRKNTFLFSCILIFRCEFLAWNAFLLLISSRETIPLATIWVLLRTLGCPTPLCRTAKPDPFIRAVSIPPCHQCCQMQRGTESSRYWGKPAYCKHHNNSNDHPQHMSFVYWALLSSVDRLLAWSLLWLELYYDDASTAINTNGYRKLPLITRLIQLRKGF